MSETETQYEPKKRHSTGWCNEARSLRGTRIKRVVINPVKRVNRMRSRIKKILPMVLRPGN
jgi:hypothetical protein